MELIDTRHRDAYGILRPAHLFRTRIVIISEQCFCKLLGFFKGEMVVPQLNRFFARGGGHPGAFVKLYCRLY